MRILFTAISAMLVILPGPARAEHVQLANGGVYYFYQYQKGVTEDFLMHERKNLDAQGYLTPVEPQFMDPPQYREMDPPRTVSGRIEAIVYGITTDIPAEYDMYATEIRRHMARVASPEVLGHHLDIEDQLENLEKAQFLLKEWKKKVTREIAEVQAVLEGDPASSGLFTGFNASKRTAVNFFTDAEKWMASHKAILEFLKENQNIYVFYEPFFAFTKEHDMKNFIAAVEHHQLLLEKVRGYRALASMIY